MMDERGKSDKPVLPVKSSNKAGPPAAERMEEIRGRRFVVEIRGQIRGQDSWTGMVLSESDGHS